LGICCTSTRSSPQAFRTGRQPSRASSLSRSPERQGCERCQGHARLIVLGKRQDLSDGARIQDPARVRDGDYSSTLDCVRVAGLPGRRLASLENSTAPGNPHPVVTEPRITDIRILRRIASPPRSSWQKKVKAAGLSWHTREQLPYWNESAWAQQDAALFIGFAQTRLNSRQIF
jgi:hypothetical protein